MAAATASEDPDLPSPEESAQMATIQFLTPSFLPSAAKRVYLILELRLRILELLDRETLVTFMRVERRVMPDVAKMIYRTIGYERVTALANISSARRAIYAGAVIEVCTSTSDLPKTLFLQAGGHYHYDDTRACLMYTKKASENIILSLRGRLPSLTKINFAGDDADEILWSANFPIPALTLLPSNNPIPSPVVTGHIEVIEILPEGRGGLPPIFLGHAPQPPERYTLSRRYDLLLNPDDNGQPARVTDAWLSSLRNDPLYGSLYTMVDLGPLPVTLDDIRSIIERQINLRHSVRLQRIVADYTLPFNINQFISFARIAGPSLTQLWLADRKHFSPGIRGHGLSFHHLDTLISTMLTHLPCLNSFQVAIHGDEDGESILRSSLSVDLLEQCGSLKDLTIYTTSADNPYLSVIRRLAPLCNAKVRIGVGQFRRTKVNSQSEYLMYLRGQPSHRRAYLSVVDFSSLGIHDCEGVFQLEYEDDGRPLSLTASKAAAAIRDMRTTGNNSTSASKLAIQDMKRVYQGKLARLDEMSTLPKTPEILSEAERLLEGIAEVRKEMEAAKKKMEELEAVISPDAIQNAADLVQSWRGMETGVN